MKYAKLIIGAATATILASSAVQAADFGFRSKWESEDVQGYTNYWAGFTNEGIALELVCQDGRAQGAKLVHVSMDSVNRFALVIDRRVYDQFQINGRPNGAKWTEMLKALSMATNVVATAGTAQVPIPTKNQGILRSALRDCRP